MATLTSMVEIDRKGGRRRYVYCHMNCGQSLPHHIVCRPLHRVEVDDAATDDTMLDAGWSRTENGAWRCSACTKKWLDDIEAQKEPFRA